MDTISTPHASTTRTLDIIDALRAPFPWDVIAVRPGSAGTLWAKDGTGADDPIQLSLCGTSWWRPRRARRGRAAPFRGVPAAA